MRIRTKYWYYAGGALLLLLLAKMAKGYNLITDWLIPELEGFRDTPYWDNKQWTWGYGTRAPGPSGIITKSQALADMRAYLAGDYAALKPLIRRNLTSSQWAALLSFSYNLGRGAANKLITDIDSGNDNVLEDHWKQYVYSGGVVSQALIDRRNLEFNIWQGYL